MGNMINNYKQQFFKNRHERTKYAADHILPIVIEALPQHNSAVDFGCGVGTWVSTLKEHGANDILGLEGPWLDEKLLEIEPQEFRSANFEEVVSLDKKYDLAMTLEVAEHLSPEAASNFVKSLVNASDFVLFSAAIPLQGGVRHLNEQWPDYWAELFRAEGYAVVDFVRCKIWDEPNIPVWYRQNILMFVKENQVSRLNVDQADLVTHSMGLSMVHPEMYLGKMNFKGGLKLIRRSFRSRIKSLLGKS
ncbi:MAG: methyltransferase domain-containing protein [Planctomycetaceae bacterium]|jgi:hypothetical protein|nr:methyltransferase domain-containing protein [Planctomycetaceae bacterium]